MATFPNQKVDTVDILTVSGDSFNGLKISNYQSSIDTTFNYLEDAIELWGKSSL